MPAAPPPFRLLSPAKYALLSSVEKTAYLRRLMADIKQHVAQVRAENNRLARWVLHKEDVKGE